MKFHDSHDARIHVLDADSSVWSVLQSIAESGVQEEAFYVLDVDDIVRKHKEWKLKLPRVQPHYAVKCNDSQTVLEVLAALGTGFDCASKVEMSKVLNLGVDPSRIIFANPVKQASHIRHAASCNVDVMTFDNETELHKIKALYPTAKLVVRIRCEAKVAQCPLGMKFGVEVNEAIELLHSARSLGLDVIGVSFHVGSGCSDPPVFARAIAAAKDLFVSAKQMGFDFDLLDLGGGYPGNKGSSIDKIAEIINCSLDLHFPDGCGVRVIAEPGRFYVASAYTLATNVHSKRCVVQEDGKTSFMYYINDGVYGSFNCLLYDHATVSPIPLKGLAGKLSLGSIWGPTCDGLDQVTSPLLLPELHVGDWVVFQDMGAYTLPCASTFNGMPVPRVHAISHKSTWLQLQGRLPMTSDHFVVGNVPVNVLAGLDLGGNGIWEVVTKLPLSAGPSTSGSSSSLSSLSLSDPPLSGDTVFLSDFLTCEPVN